jgi:hypothetical protein
VTESGRGRVDLHYSSAAHQFRGDHGPTLGVVNTGVAIIEAPDEATARRIMEEDPAIAGGFAKGELRPFKVSLLRGRD